MIEIEKDPAAWLDEVLGNVRTLGNKYVRLTLAEAVVILNALRAPLAQAEPDDDEVRVVKEYLREVGIGASSQIVRNALRQASRVRTPTGRRAPNQEEG